MSTPPHAREKCEQNSTVGFLLDGGWMSHVRPSLSLFLGCIAAGGGSVAGTVACFFNASLSCFGTLSAEDLAFFSRFSFLQKYDKYWVLIAMIAFTPATLKKGGSYRLSRANETKACCYASYISGGVLFGSPEDKGYGHHSGLRGEMHMLCSQPSMSSFAPSLLVYGVLL